MPSAPRRPWKWLLAVAVIVALGVKLSYSNRVYFELHEEAMEQLANDIFADRSIHQLALPEAGASYWFVNGELVTRDQPLPPPLNGHAFHALEAFAKDEDFRIPAMKAYQERLKQLGLSGFSAAPDNQTASFYRKKDGKVVVYDYAEQGELYLDDPSTVDSERLDTHWTMKIVPDPALQAKKPAQ